MPKGETVGIEIIERIARREGVEPEHLTTKLYEAIDPDALAALTTQSDRPGAEPALRVEFTYHGYRVTVDGAESVTVDEHRPEETEDGAASGGPVGG